MPDPSPEYAALPAPEGVRILPVAGLPEVREGADLGLLLHEALSAPGGAGLLDGDVLCVSTKIVSKALGLVIDREDKQAAIARASVRVVARRRHDRVVTSVVQTPHGAVMAAAGIDGSNSPGGLLLLPDDPDAEARHLHGRLRDLLGGAGSPRFGVLLTDTSSRIWRQGVGDIALGAAGVASLQDLRGSADADGKVLSVTVRDLADELAAAADLVKGKASGVPAAIVRGVPGALAAPGVPAGALNRLPPEDWFARPSLESAWQALGVAARDEPVARMSPEDAEVRIARALEIARLPREGSPALSARAEIAGPDLVRILPAGPSRAALLDAGALAERVRTALRAEHDWSPLPPIAVLVEDDGPAADARPVEEDR